MHRSRLLGATALLVAPLSTSLAACTTSNGGGTGGATTSVCAGDPRASVYSVGLSAATTDGAIKASFVDAMPDPPTRGENTWVVQLTDAMGKPVNGATIAVKPFMPDHGHGSSITPQVMPMTGMAGAYQVSLLDLFMPGVWAVTFTVTPASGPVETLVFTFCVDG